jgi:transcriptional regulator with XRE-family HTH domain
MSALSIRIRRARAIAAFSQGELARRVGVKRSAVTQWERVDGTLPSMEHMIRIALETGVSFEWIATGRGPSRLDDSAEQGLITTDFARDADETNALSFLRAMNASKRRVVMQILEAVSR